MTKKQFILAVAPKLNCSEPVNYSCFEGIVHVNFHGGSGHTEVFCDKTNKGVSIKFKGRLTQFGPEVIPEVETLLQGMGIDTKVDFYITKGMWGRAGLPALRIRCASYPWKLCR